MAEPSGSHSSPILAPAGASPADASRPDTRLDGRTYHVYESHPVPWWLALIWMAFFAFGALYLILNLIP